MNNKTRSFFVSNISSLIPATIENQFPNNCNSSFKPLKVRLFLPYSVQLRFKFSIEIRFSGWKLSKQTAAFLLLVFPIICMSTPQDHGRLLEGLFRRPLWKMRHKKESHTANTNLCYSKELHSVSATFYLFIYIYFIYFIFPLAQLCNCILDDNNMMHRNLVIK